MLFEGDDLGKWLDRQKNPGTWAQLSTEQQERLSKLGVQPIEAPSPAPAAARSTKGGPSKAQQAFQRGVHALAQWVKREGADRPVPRGHSEEIAVDGETRDDGRETGRVDLEHQIEARQAHPEAAGRSRGAGRRPGRRGIGRPGRPGPADEGRLRTCRAAEAAGAAPP
ncbi:helicase associated domain-containing protein [Streptomyces microflavus]|uniref:helicase associated domain-containing protein n=1 Tax=Streptomyces microflavus TaxID=1919 RepID=UPI00380880A3